MVAFAAAAEGHSAGGEPGMTRRDIAFDAEGVTLRGWFYAADGGACPVRP